MALLNKELQVIQGILAKLDPKNEKHRASPEVTKALIEANKSAYMDTWVLGPLKLLLAAQEETGYHKLETLRLAASLAN